MAKAGAEHHRDGPHKSLPEIRTAPTPLQLCEGTARQARWSVRELLWYQHPGTPGLFCSRLAPAGSSATRRPSTVRQGPAGRGRTRLGCGLSGELRPFSVLIGVDIVRQRHRVRSPVHGVSREREIPARISPSRWKTATPPMVVIEEPPLCMEDLFE